MNNVLPGCAISAFNEVSSFDGLMENRGHLRDVWVDYVHYEQQENR